MITTRKVLPIFLASPGDLSVERQYAKACVDEWNAVNEERTGWSANLMGWEDTLPQTGRPQEIINGDVKRCTIFIGMMWRKWGSATGNGFTSGFHEEFELARALAGEQGSPRIAMFFKEVPSLDDPGDELKKVLAFKSEIIAGKSLLFKELPEDTDGWRTGFRQNVHRLIFDYIEEQSAPVTAPAGIQPDATEEAQPADASVGENLALLRALIARCDGVETEQEVSRAQIAQLRLAALSWKRQGLSEAYLGTHDANIIYRAANELSITQLEHFGLIEAGLSNLREQSAPLWKWLATTETGLDYIQVLAVYADDEALAVPAYQVLAMLKAPIGLWRQRLDRRFAELKPDVKKAAISYLARVGDENDAPLLRAEIARADVSTRDAAATGLALIFCRESVAKALTFIIDDLDTLPRGVAFLLERFDSLGRDTIQRALSHRDSEIRATALPRCASSAATPRVKRRHCAAILLHAYAKRRSSTPWRGASASTETTCARFSSARTDPPATSFCETRPATRNSRRSSARALRALATPSFKSSYCSSTPPPNTPTNCSRPDVGGSRPIRCGPTSPMISRTTSTASRRPIA